MSAPQHILEADLGVVPLEMIKAELESDDWKGDGHLMYMFLKGTKKANDIELGPWIEGRSAGTGSKVKGKLRSLEMRAPVPPAPMCPKESRVATTYHVVCDDSKILFESVIMSLDVPYGTCFNVIECDTFSYDPSTKHTIFERRLSLEWVKSCWVKALVEINVPKEVKADAEQFVETVRDWATQRAAGDRRDNSVRSAGTAMSAGTRRSNRSNDSYANAAKGSPHRSNDSSVRSSRR